MATINKFYLHDATTTDTGTLPASTTVSASSPTITATGASTNRVMDGSIGALQTSAAITTNAQSSTAQSAWFRRWVSAPIAAQTLSFSAAADLSIGGGLSESSTNSLFTAVAVVAVWRPGTGAVVTRILDPSGTGMSSSASEAWGAVNIGGTAASATSQDGDILVLEIWRSSTTQSMATAYTNTFFYDGTTEGSGTSAASYLNFGTAVVMSGGAAVVIPDVNMARIAI